jgi:formylglycine-generating enzyme required for sulfatase activity
VTHARAVLFTGAVVALAVARLASASSLTPDGMALVPGGTFVMGTSAGAGFEGPPHRVTIAAFFLDRSEVTNDAFARFVRATRHVTTAERDGESSVFVPLRHAWSVIPGATWRHPEGPASTIDFRGAHPVVHVSWGDASAYCAWAGGRLPTEAEWERAARGGVDGARFPWDDADDGTVAHANTWQGRFPDRDLGTDGFRGTAPVGHFAPNAYGLFDMAGNVWEWTADWFDPRAYEGADGAIDPRGPDRGTERVIRGGSWLCSATHCIGYRAAARGKARPGEGTNHIGFRCARSAS